MSIASKGPDYLLEPGPLDLTYTLKTLRDSQPTADHLHFLDSMPVTITFSDSYSRESVITPLLDQETPYLLVHSEAKTALAAASRNHPSDEVRDWFARIVVRLFNDNTLSLLCAVSG